MKHHHSFRKVIGLCMLCLGLGIISVLLLMRFVYGWKVNWFLWALNFVAGLWAAWRGVHIVKSV